MTSWNAGDQERDRIQLTITGVRLADAEARALNLNGQVQPGLGEGTRKTGSPGIFVPSLNSGLPYARDAIARGLRAIRFLPLLGEVARRGFAARRRGRSGPG